MEVDGLCPVAKSATRDAEYLGFVTTALIQSVCKAEHFLKLPKLTCKLCITYCK